MQQRSTRNSVMMHGQCHRTQDVLHFQGVACKFSFAQFGMASIPQLRPRSAEADAVASTANRSEDVAMLDTEAQTGNGHNAEHSNPAAMSMQVCHSSVRHCVVTACCAKSPLQYC